LTLSGFVITMFLIPRDKAFLITGGCLAGFGMLMSVYYGIRMIMVAFNESLTCGLLYLFLPFYPLYYLITRWERMGAFFLMQFGYSFVIGAGAGMMALAPMMGKDKDEVWLDRPARPLIVAVAASTPDETTRGVGVVPF
jgi:hypothetical protein